MIESLLTTKSLNNNKNKDTTSDISNALSEITKIKENNSVFKSTKQLNKEKNKEKEMNKQIPRQSIRLKKK